MENTIDNKDTDTDNEDNGNNKQKKIQISVCDLIHFDSNGIKNLKTLSLLYLELIEQQNIPISHDVLQSNFDSVIKKIFK